MTAAACFLAAMLFLTYVVSKKPREEKNEAPQAPSKITIAVFYNGCSVELDENTEAGRLAILHCKLQGRIYRERA